MNCKKCNSVLEEGDLFCNNCGEPVNIQNETPTVITEPKNENNFGWGVLGFFIPIVGLILFIIWLKNKKGAAKAAGLGALIGVILETIFICSLLFIFPQVFGLMTINNGNNEDNGLPTYDVVINPSIELYGDTGIQAYEKEKYSKLDSFKYLYYINLDGEESHKDFYNDVKYNVYDSNHKKLFQLVFYKSLTGGQEDICKFITNSGEVFYNHECSSYNYDFYYKDDLIIFGDTILSRGDFYAYNLKENTLTKLFTKEDNKPFEVIDLNIDDKDKIVLKTFIYDDDNESYRKRSIITDIEYSGDPSTDIDTIEKLEARLLKEGFDNFVVEKDLTFVKGNKVYTLSSDTKEKTIKEYFSEIKGTTNVTSSDDCTGTVTKGDSKYEYIVEKPLNTQCETVTYKLNDDFTFSYSKSGKESINGGTLDGHYILSNYSGVQEYKFYISGKTLVVSTMHQTTINGHFSTTLINTDGKTYNFEANPNGMGRDVNLLDTEGYRDDSFRIDDNGNLVVRGIKFNSLIETDYLGDYADVAATCSKTVDEVASAYNTTADGAFVADYTYKLNSKGLYDFKYSSKETFQTIEDAYNKYCN